MPFAAIKMLENLSLEKKNIRQTILQKRLSLTETEISDAEVQMLTILKNCDFFKKSNSIHIYISKKYEPKTSKIIKFCWKRSKVVNVPCVIPGTGVLFHSELNSFNDLSKGDFGVLEPTPKKRIASKPENFDLVIVPGIAFDINGGRIGYGKGFYDRFLLQTRAFRLALAFDFQVIESIPAELHDVPMNGIITESKMILINN